MVINDISMCIHAAWLPPAIVKNSISKKSLCSKPSFIIVRPVRDTNSRVCPVSPSVLSYNGLCIFGEHQ
jgi:hypothetical protein